VFLGDVIWCEISEIEDEEELIDGTPSQRERLSQIFQLEKDLPGQF
jgi:hypothetical protein